jgi:capsular polysaccharide transport system permease protein
MPYDYTRTSTHAAGVDWRAAAARYRWPLLFIVLPTLVAAIYLLFFAADQYVSEASFLIRSTQPQQTSASMLERMLSGGGEAQSSAPEEAAGVVDFLTSHDAAQQLQKNVNLVGMYRRSGLDFLGRIKSDPKEEDLTKYYRRHVKVTLDKSSGIVKLQVRAFTPSDSKRIADQLLAMSEVLVNRFSKRAEGDAVAVAQAEVDRAQMRLAALGGDPNSSSTASVAVMGGLEGQLAAAKAEFIAASGYLRPGAPRLEELRARIDGIQNQIDVQRSKLTGPGGGEAGYDRAITERAGAMRDYQAALATYQTARLDALKQHLYLVRVVEPNLAQKSLYPQRGLTILTVFASLLVAYGVGWLLLTGTREHAA